MPPEPDADSEFDLPTQVALQLESPRRQPAVAAENAAQDAIMSDDDGASVMDGSLQDWSDESQPLQSFETAQNQQTSDDDTPGRDGEEPHEQGTDGDDPADFEHCHLLRRDQVELCARGLGLETEDVFAGWEDDEEAQQLLEAVQSDPLPALPASDAPGSRDWRFDRRVNPFAIREPAEIAASYTEALEQSLAHLVRSLLAHEFYAVAFRTRDQNNMQRLSSEAYGTLLFMEAKMLKALIERNVTEKYHDEAWFSQHMDGTEQRAIDAGQATIYQQAITDARGPPPTPQDVQQICRDMHTYCNDFSRTGRFFALVIDEQVGTPTSADDAAQDVRKYLNYKPAKPLAKRRKIVNTFRNNLEARTEGAKLQNRPGSAILEFGLTMDVRAKFHAHQTHTKSHFLISLFHAIAKYRYGDKYVLNQKVVYLAAVRSHAAMGETLITRLGQGCIVNGTGFTFHPPGLRFPTTRNREKWRGF